MGVFRLLLISVPGSVLVLEFFTRRESYVGRLRLNLATDLIDVGIHPSQAVVRGIWQRRGVVRVNQIRVLPFGSIVDRRERFYRHVIIDRALRELTEQLQAIVRCAGRFLQAGPVVPESSPDQFILDMLVKSGGVNQDPIPELLNPLSIELLQRLTGGAC